MAKNDKLVPVSQIAQMATCEKQSQLRSTHGDRKTPEQERLARKGDREHRRFHFQVKKHHARDCFIATAVYGSDAPETNQLRQFRDTTLVATRPGRIAIRLYYWVSPPVARWLRHSPRMVSLTRRILDLTVVLWTKEK